MLKELRTEIDDCDKILVETLNKRFTAVMKVADYKKKHKLPIYHAGREQEILANIEGPFKNDVQALYNYMFELSRSNQLYEVFPYNIVLIGFMGSGKSRVGYSLAKHSGHKLYDVDKLIEQQENMSIKDIFKTKGEVYFRRVEQACINKISINTRAIISCGGGSVLESCNVSDLKAKGKLIWLQSSLTTIISRLDNNRGRPLLEGKTEKDIKDLFEQRSHLYEKIADYCIVTDEKTPEDISKEIINKILRINETD